MTREWFRDPYFISTAPERLDLDVIHGFLSLSYWAAGRSRERVEASIAHSIPIGLYHGAGAQGRAEQGRAEQVGFARVVSDHTTFAYLADVFVLDQHRGRGLGVWLVETALGLPECEGARWRLGTRDAHELYRKFGFRETPPGRMMRREGIDKLLA
jgi:GNAT superfamily N-acetyltransferase